MKNYFEVKFFEPIKNEIENTTDLDEIYEIFNFQGSNYGLRFKRGNQVDGNIFLFQSYLLSKLKS